MYKSSLAKKMFGKCAKNVIKFICSCISYETMPLIPLLLFVILPIKPSLSDGNQHNGLYDLTYPVNNITLDWSGEKFSLNITSEQADVGNISYWYQLDEFWTPTHLGTHLDAPCHFGKGKWCVSDIPVERLFQRPGYIIDITSKSANDPDYLLTENDLNEWLEAIGGSVKPGAILLVRTNWSQYWPNRVDYFGLKESNDSYHFPGLSTEAAKLIVAKKEELNIYGLGIEGPSVDNGQSKTYQTHTILAAENIYNIENIGPLINQLPDKDFLVTALPIRIDGASGSPVRILAQICANNSRSSYDFTLIIALIMILPFIVRLIQS